MYEKIYTVPLLQPKQSWVHIRKPNWRDVSLATTEKCKCRCWIAKWRCHIIPQFWSAGSKAAWSKAGRMTCKSRRAAERRWRRLVLAVTECTAPGGTEVQFDRHSKMIVQSLKTVLSGTGNQWRSSRSVGVMRWNFCSALWVAQQSAKLTAVSLWQRCLSDTTHYFSSLVYVLLSPSSIIWYRCNS